jgi:hypothetical protein
VCDKPLYQPHDVIADAANTKVGGGGDLLLGELGFDLRVIEAVAAAQCDDDDLVPDAVVLQTHEPFKVRVLGEAFAYRVESLLQSGKLRAVDVERENSGSSHSEYIGCRRRPQ